jgi:hypothetical protein
MTSNAPIFIVGPPRSGTHLVRFCLSKHSNIFISPETSFFIRAYGNRRLDRDLFRKDQTARLVDELIDQSGDPTMADYDSVRNALKNATSGSADYAAFVDAFFGTMAKHAGKKRWGEKTPLHALYLPQILSVFPDARIIIVMREAKNTLASTLKSGHVRAGFYNALAVYLRCLREQRRMQRSPNVVSLDYESFVANPKNHLQRICTFLGEPYEPAMLQPGMLDSSYAEDVMSVRSDIEIAPNDPDKWRRGLSAERGAFVDKAVTSVRGAGLFSSQGLRLLIERVRLAVRIFKNRAGFFYLGHHSPKARTNPITQADTSQ